MTPEILLLDACVAINMAAADCSETLSLALGLTFVMAEQAAYETGDVAEEERIVVRSYERREPFRARVLELSESETALYVVLARDIDDGEAASIAIAATRRLPIVTDDRKARRVAERAGISSILSTADILRAYEIKASLSNSEIKAILLRIEQDAHFHPRRTDALIAWWTSITAGAPSKFA